MINAVIDISHHNGPALNFDKAKAAGIIGVIHKATKGLPNFDPIYAVQPQEGDRRRPVVGAPITLPPAGTASLRQTRFCMRWVTGPMSCSRLISSQKRMARR